MGRSLEGGVWRVETMDESEPSFPLAPHNCTPTQHPSRSTYIPSLQSPPSPHPLPQFPLSLPPSPSHVVPQPPLPSSVRKVPHDSGGLDGAVVARHDGGHALASLEQQRVWGGGCGWQGVVGGQWVASGGRDMVGGTGGGQQQGGGMVQQCSSAGRKSCPCLGCLIWIMTFRGGGND